MSTPVRPRADEPQRTGWDSMSMFDELVAHAVDDDYAAVTQQGPRPRTRGSLVATILVLAVFAALIAVSAVQTRAERPAAQTERDRLVAEIGQQQGFLDDKRERGAALQEQVRTLTAQRPDTTSVARLDALRRTTGQVAVTGPGVRVVADNAEDVDDEPRGRVLDRDLQLLVNGLWLAGAEAISVNGNRLTTLSSIRTAGEAITVNYRSLSPPYVVRAVGDPRTLESRFLDTPSGQAWTSLQKNYGVRFETSVSTDLELPAAPQRRLALRYATRLGDGG
ncbi:DUF881 domain-containing protein [Solicola sp. PLA-1-18]|uniref:DUF881 domain-containing protein n=1 Tax=Solicola sp. PLA-1-18 TaxID=3380532 RepID=UPI003B7BDE8F